MTRQAPLKILYVITKSNFGGAQRYVHDLARAAKAEGHDVVVAFGGDGALGGMLRDADIRTVALSALGRDVSPWSDLRSFFHLYRLIRRESPDVLHLNSSKAGALGALAARLANLVAVLPPSGAARRRVAAVFTGHGWAFNEERGAVARALIRIVHWLTIQASHCVIAVSRATQRQVLALPFVRNKIVVVHNGIPSIPLRHADEAWTRIVSGTAWERLHPKKPPLVVGSISELHRNKGLGYALDAVALLKERTGVPPALVVLGEGEERRALEERIRERGLEDDVLLAGFRPGACELLAPFDVFLLSSITEAFPYAILEAGNAGLAIVATRVGGIGDVIEDMESGVLVEPHDADAIARAIQLLLDDPERRARLAGRARTRVVESFSLAKMARTTFSVYEAVTGRLRGVQPPADVLAPVAPPAPGTGDAPGPTKADKARPGIDTGRSS